ncbi:hypothetical protein FMUAM8_30450 [Nocardia cyriacigeorgica]|nr:hypothetical protein FMUAM8_30450 [Nocardia cyriacigeorgica]
MYSRHPRAQRRTLVTIAVVLTALGLFGTGLTTGFWANNERIAHSASSALSSPAPVPSESEDEQLGSMMPDVRGLSEPVARQVLADSAAGGARVDTESRPHAGLSGIVIEQQPAFGTAVPDVVRLTISAPAAVPAVDGRTETEIRAQLLELGVQANVVRRYARGSAPGAVLGIEPPAGSPLPETVTVTVADTAATAYLADVEATENACAAGSYTQAGARKDNALSCRVNNRRGSEPKGPIWEFARAVDEIELTFGLPTDAKPGSSVRVAIYVDGRPAGETEVAYGATADLGAVTTGALQFMIVVTPTGGDPDTVTVTGTVRGSRDGIVALTEDE